MSRRTGSNAGRVTRPGDGGASAGSASGRAFCTWHSPSEGPGHVDLDHRQLPLCACVGDGTPVGAKGGVVQWTSTSMCWCATACLQADPARPFEVTVVETAAAAEVRFPSASVNTLHLTRRG